MQVSSSGSIPNPNCALLSTGFSPRLEISSTDSNQREQNASEELEIL